MARQLVFLVLLLLVFACGEKTAPEEDQGGTGATSRAQRTWDAALATATISGVVKLEGTPPPRRPIDMSQEAHCAEHQEGEVLSEDVIVNPDGTLRNVFVWIKEGLGGYKFPVPEEPVVLDQLNCQYVPHVVGVRAKQELKIHNSDPVMHNIRATPKRNKKFNFSQHSKGQEDSRTFPRREIPIKVKCDVHGWMGAYLCVVENPFFQVTGDGGIFELGKLPPGTYTVAAWHELYGEKTRSLTVGDTETKKVEFRFKAQ
ncbi:MAG: carboxypeptidase regulatory-like domain-containing protein [Planctomycetota bacterium]